MLLYCQKRPGSRSARLTLQGKTWRKMRPACPFGRSYARTRITRYSTCECSGVTPAWEEVVTRYSKYGNSYLGFLRDRQTQLAIACCLTCQELCSFSLGGRQIVTAEQRTSDAGTPICTTTFLPSGRFNKRSNGLDLMGIGLPCASNVIFVNLYKLMYRSTI